MRNKVALVTGASRGLGLAICLKLLEKQFIVYGVSKSKTHWKNAYRQTSNHKLFQLIQCDLTSKSKTLRLVKNIQIKQRSIDLLINNAGYCGPLNNIENIPQSDLERNLHNNLYSSFFLTQAILPHWKRSRKEKLAIHIASMAGVRAVPRLFSYSLSKFGMLALSQCLAKENPKNIKSITVCPGGIQTTMREKLFGKKDCLKQQTPEYIADIISKIIDNKIKVESGGDIHIRYGKITDIRRSPSK